MLLKQRIGKTEMWNEEKENRHGETFLKYFKYGIQQYFYPFFNIVENL